MIRSTQLLFAALCGIGIVSTAFAGQAAVAPANPFKPGDQVVVASTATKLMRGDTVLATVNTGQTLRALKVEGPWVGTTVTVNGKTIGGWVWSRQLATPRQYQALRQPIQRRYSYQPAPIYEGRYYGQPIYTQPLMMGETPYGPSYWRADRKLIGY